MGTAGTSSLVVTPGTDGCLFLYTEEAFTGIADRLEQTSPTAPDVRAFSRLFFARAQRVDVDSQGRIRIPVELGEMVSLDGEGMLLGVRDHLELWDRLRWEQYQQEKQQHYDQLAEKAFERAS